ncbi:GyrI-like domain-containing protein [Kibdelosporangium persicum]|uniref:Transcriptional regulator n=1 Tax=Kibdelosporangium persicum TaxID=2698649 RepID=A0ABX2EW21_9PSEU|nr:GyrI-like domain-containing protein [Kibdelosporangium persicum]NRN63074.1 Transcriptional regulator [Kibdelosporangium persicum]
MNEYKHLFSGKQEPALIEVPSLPYLMVDGKGAPESPEYSNAVSALYAVAYAVRAALKPVVQYSVLPLQGQWWSPDPAVFTSGDRSQWCWTMMILQPPQATAEIAAAAIGKAAQRKAVDGVRFELFTEGTCAQILHKGPYSEEPATIARLMAFVRAQGRRITGNHHEIYLTRPRTDAPEKMRTLIRYPV